MLDSGKYTIADIAAKMAKTESFIAQRLKLVDLIDEVREDFIAGKLGIGHAILIARCNPTKQMSIYDDAKPWRGEGEPDYGTVAKLREDIEDDSYDLTDAKFDLNDANLVKGCVACSVCPKRSGANPILFDDMVEDRCFDETCFDKKEEAHIENEVAKIINNGENVVLVAGWNKPKQMILDICKQFNINIYQQYSWYDHLQKDKDGVEWNKTKAFGVSGDKEGKYFDAWIKPQEEDSENNKSITGETSNEVRELKEAISKIESRADRAKELDGEKVWAQIRAIDTSEIKTIIGGLFEVEVNAVCLAMISKLGYYGNQEVKKLVGDFNLQTLQERDFTKFEYNQIQRIFFLECLPVAFGNYYSNACNYAYTKALMHYESDKINEIIANQKAISDVRMDKADIKIKELKAKIEKLQPVAEPKKEAPERIEDKVEIKHFTSEIKQFDKVDKKYALNNSYFKNRKNSYPANPLEVAMYHEQHGTLPFDYSGTDWLYETYIEYQKRNSVYHSQFFTPPATALRIASLADRHFVDPKGEANGRPWVMDMCCGFGMLSKPIRELGFIVRGFDFSTEMVDLYNLSQDCIAERCDYENDAVELYDWVVSNPPYEVPKLTKFFERLHSEILADNGKAIILLPKGFMLKEKPKALVEILEKFNIIHSEDMTEDFAHTKIKAEIVVLEKA